MFFNNTEKHGFLLFSFVVGILLHLIDPLKHFSLLLQNKDSIEVVKEEELNKLRLKILSDVKEFSLFDDESYHKFFEDDLNINYCEKNANYFIRDTNQSMLGILTRDENSEDRRSKRQIESLSSVPWFRKGWIRTFGNRETKIVAESYSQFGLNIGYFFHVNAPILNSRRRSKLLTCVMSSASREGAERRKSIRNTWGRDTRTHALFFVSIRDIRDERVMNRLIDEFFQWEDLVFLDLPSETNSNAYILDTYKSLMILDAIDKHFQRHPRREWKWLLRVTDRAFISSRKLYFFLLSKVQEKVWGVWNEDHSRLIRREKNSKSCLDNYNFPGTKYPEHFDPEVYAVERSAVSCILEEVESDSDMKYVFVEEIFLSLVLAKCGVNFGEELDDIVYPLVWSEGDHVESVVYLDLEAEQIETIFGITSKSLRSRSRQNDGDTSQARLLIVPFVLFLFSCALYILFTQAS
eukprot:snap_masked-scaffold_8-processed-gene-9.29-mRNA-1 protein AED:1.00 eAED:1.00 QI:0/-1/0/0/-1/1/1/0/464